MKFNYSSLKKSTPWRIRKLSGAMLTACMSASGFSILSKYDSIALIFMLTGVISTFLLNFFCEDDRTDKKQ